MEVIEKIKHQLGNLTARIQKVSFGFKILFSVQVFFDVNACMCGLIV